MAFIWNYADIFLMLVGESLRFKLRQISQKVKELSKVQVKSLNKIIISISYLFRMLH